MIVVKHSISFPLEPVAYFVKTSKEADNLILNLIRDEAGENLKYNYIGRELLTDALKTNDFQKIVDAYLEASGIDFIKINNIKNI